MEQELGRFLALWFGSVDPAGGPADQVGRVMRLNSRAAPGSVDGGVEILVVEQQGVWRWGRDSAGRYVERGTDPGSPWRPTGETTDEFWLHVAAVEAVWALPATRSALQLPSAAVDAVERATRPLPARAWSWPGPRQRIRTHGAAVVMICADGDASWVVASAPDEAALDWLDELDLPWD